MYSRCTAAVHPLRFCGAAGTRHDRGHHRSDHRFRHTATEVHFAVLQARVTIVDTTDPGYVHFESSTATAHERAERVTLNVLRKRGATGALKVLYLTQSDTAVAGA